MATLLVLVSGCGFVPIAVGPDAPVPDPPIDFARALELARVATDVTQNTRLTSDDLRTLYTIDDVEVYVFNTVLPGDDGETRFMLLTDRARRRQTLALGGTNTYRQWQFDALTVPAYQEDLDAAVHAGWNLLTFAVINNMLSELRTDYTLTIAEFRAATALRVGAQRGTRTSELAVACCGAARVVSFDTTAAAVDALVAGAVDGVTLDDTELAGQQARSPGRLAVLPGPVGAYVLPLGADLTDALNAAAYQLQAEGETAALLEKWSR